MSRFFSEKLEGKKDRKKNKKIKINKWGGGGGGGRGQLVVGGGGCRSGGGGSSVVVDGTCSW